MILIVWLCSLDGVKHKEGIMKIAIFVIYVLACFSCGFISAIIGDEQRLPNWLTFLIGLWGFFVILYVYFIIQYKMGWL